MVPRILLRLASLLSLGLTLLALAEARSPLRPDLSEPDREIMLALLEESWEALDELGGGRAIAGDRSKLHEALRLRMQTATSLGEAHQVLSDLLRVAASRPAPQGQETPEASIPASRTPTWFPARLW
jgi:hypothetical protein